MARFTVAMVDYDYDSLAPIEEEVRKLGGDFIHRRCRDVAEAISWAGSADGWIVQYLKPIDAAVFSRCPNLKVVGRTGIGVDVIDVPAATAHGVIVTNVPSYCESEVSDHALALILTCLRRTATYTHAVRRGVWDWKIARPIPRLAGLTLGLVGFGKIPRALAPKARALGMNVICADPYLSADVARKEGVELVPFDELLARSDVVSIHCPLTKQTERLFGASAFERMKRSAVLINTARGGIVDSDALAQALKRGLIAGAGLDVLPQEPPRPDDPLLALENVVITPHVAWYSEDSIVELQRRIGRNVATACAGRVPEAVVNPEVLPKLGLAR